MQNNPFFGRWTYRSFYNRPEPVGDFEKIHLFEADLVLADGGQDLVGGSLRWDGGELTMSGTFVREDPPTIRMRATGVAGTSTAGWIYDYVGYLTRNWRESDAQRPAIVGTLMRTVPHGQRPAGFTASFVAVSRDRPPDPYRLPDNVIKHFADRLHRLHHAIWHGLRNTWEIVPDSKRKRIANVDGIDWTPPRPSKEFINDIYKRPYIVNGSGEDFLYMHREMLNHYRMLMQEAGQEPIVWIEIPPPGGSVSGDEVPPAWPIPQAPSLERRIAALKTDDFYWGRMKWWDLQFKDPTYLATLTLGELGSLLEYSVHNDMHMRWSALPRDPDTNAPFPTGRDPNSDYSEKWDNAKYDTLLDFYSSHVNPVFWRLHGWIDDRIDDWFAAQECVRPGTIVRTCDGVPWFEPDGTWVKVADPWVWPKAFSNGNMPHDGEHPGHGGRHGGHHHGGHDIPPEERQKRIASMQKVLAILAEPEGMAELALRPAGGQSSFWMAFSFPL
jgi:hypothetical protein